MAKESPTQRSLKHLRAIYPLVEVVERWNPYAKIRQDLFNFVDILCVGNGETVAVQTTSGSHVAARIQKMQDSDAIAHLRKAGWKILVHGWRRVKVKRGEKATKWELREVDIS